MVHAPTSLALARIKREPLADLPIAEPLEQALRDQGHAWRERLLTPLVTLRLMLIQVLAGNCAIAALRQLAGVDFAPSSYSMPDTPELRAHFSLPPGTREGVGYPMGKLMGLLDLATGMFASLLALPLFTHDMRGVVELHPMLRAGDILLGDRAFCSFCHFALLNARGVLATSGSPSCTATAGRSRPASAT